MICYRDMSFCMSDCNNTECPRNFTPEVQEAADKWWGKEGAPIAFMDFSKMCSSYIKGK